MQLSCCCRDPSRALRWGTRAPLQPQLPRTIRLGFAARAPPAPGQKPPTGRRRRFAFRKPTQGHGRYAGSPTHPRCASVPAAGGR